MHILVTNDDGVQAPGLLALAQEMRKLGKVTVLAPDRNWSGGGHVKTLDRALRVREVRLADGTQAFASDGAPSDCVALATLGYFKESIGLVVSGINAGANLGHDVTTAGSVAGTQVLNFRSYTADDGGVAAQCSYQLTSAHGPQTERAVVTATC